MNDERQADLCVWTPSLVKWRAILAVAKETDLKLEIQCQLI